jgi:hypothetical protein
MLNRTQRILPLAPGITARQTPAYERHGVTSLFAALDVTDGSCTGEFTGGIGTRSFHASSGKSTRLFPRI